MWDREEGEESAGARPALETCALLGENGNGVLCLDGAGYVKYANAAACSLLARPASELVGREIGALIDFGLGGAATGSGAGVTERWPAAPVVACIARHSGALLVECRCKPVCFDDGGQGLLIVVNEAADRGPGNAAEPSLPYHDLLTELPNRRLLSERLEFEISRASRHGDGFALHLIELEDLAGTIDRHSHALADRRISLLADRLRSIVRVSDTLARVSGSRFAVIQVGVDGAEDAIAFARKLLAECRRPLRSDDVGGVLQGAIGVAIHAAGGCESSLWAEAEVALSQAKQSPDEGFALNRPLSTNAGTEAELAAELRRAIDDDQLDLVYQPQLSLGSQVVVGVEALLRWHHPRLGEVGPAVFVPLAERHGLIDTLGEWVLAHACRQIRRWIAAGVPFGRVSINVSPLQLVGSDRVNAMLALIEAHGVPWSALEIEISEAAYFRAGREVIDALGEFQARGIRIAIDNFGSRYSPLLACRPLNADSLKLDRLFIGQLDDVESARLVRETIALAHTLGMAVVAEGVETVSQLGQLRCFQCDCCQGFLLGEPVATAGLEPKFFGLRHAWPECVSCQPDGETDDPHHEILGWSAAYETGIPQLDMQHRTLTDLINRLVLAVRRSTCIDGWVHLLDEMVDYADYHFRCEEAFMIRYGVVSAHADLHRARHVQALAMMRQRIAACRDGGGDLPAFCSDLARWLETHMLAEDKTLGEQIVTIEGGCDPERAYRSTMFSAALECR